MQQTLFPAMQVMANLLTKIKHSFYPSSDKTSTKCERQTTQPSSTLPQTADEYTPHDHYTHIHPLTTSTEGDLAIIRSDRTGKLLVAKHTKAHQVIRPGDGPIYLFPNEAKILLKNLGGGRKCANVVQMFGAERSGMGEPGRHFLFLEYCSGGDLLDQLSHFLKMGKGGYGSSSSSSSSQHLLVRSKAMQAKDSVARLARFEGECLVPEMFVLHVFAGLVQALAFIHGDGEGGEGGREGVIHGDIKPDNVLLRWSSAERNECGMPDVVLADFGASQLASKTRGISGTPGYDSPEVHEVAKLKHTAPRVFERKKGERVMSTKSDIYQLGHLMYLVASVDRWTTGANPETLVLPEEYTTEYCRHLATTIAWCLAVRPAKRPSAKEDLMPIVQTSKGQRDSLFQERGPLPPACWRAAAVL